MKSPLERFEESLRQPLLSRFDMAMERLREQDEPFEKRLLGKCASCGGDVFTGRGSPILGSKKLWCGYWRCFEDCVKKGYE